MKKIIKIRRQTAKSVAFLVLLLSFFASPRTAVLAAPASSLLNKNTSAASGFSGQPNGNAPAGEVSHVPVRSLLYRGATTRIYARLMPFFVRGGGEGHLDIGYGSDDRAEVQAQVADMKARGVDGAILDWYGPRKEHHERVAKLLREQAEAQQFEFALSVDVGAVKACQQATHNDENTCLVSDLNYAADHYFDSPSYMRRNNRPVLFFFGLEQHSIDWNSVRRAVKGNPLLVFRNSGAFDHRDSDGGFAWIGDTTEPRNGLEYLNRFYRKGVDEARERPVLIFGSAYKGFDNSLAGWGKRKQVPQDCGRTWLATFQEANSFFSVNHQLPDLQLLTWNDYEEGTELESGIDNCVELRPNVSGNELKWDIGNGFEGGIDHFEIYAARGNAAPVQVATLARKDRTFRLGQLPAGETQMWVKAIGAPFFQNRISQPIPLHAQ